MLFLASVELELVLVVANTSALFEEDGKGVKETVDALLFFSFSVQFISVPFLVAVKDQSKDTEVIPEAATDTINIWPASQLGQKYSIVVYSSSGTQVLSTEASGDMFHPIELDITGLAPGVYTVYVTPRNGSVQKLKFLKY